VFDGIANRTDQLPTTTKTHTDTRGEENITAQQTRQKEQEYGGDYIPLPDLIAEQNPEEGQANPVAKEPWQHMLLGVPQSGLISNPNLPKRSIASTSLFIVIAFALLLLGQFTFFNRDHLNRHFPLRGIITDICEFIGCSTEPLRDINRIEIVNRNVLAHPSILEALMITATFVNIAPFPQPYPIMQISLTNLQGKVIAARRFSPQEYLSGTQSSTKLMPPGQPVIASTEVLDPGHGVVAFEFKFY
jgi:hypothetical protein